MKVKLIDYTGCESPNADYAIDTLIFTKSTRLTMSPKLLEEITNWPKARKLEELDYMSKTIPSSWEFVHYTFLIEGVSRAFTHQFVRSRHWSFAQQTMRVLKMEGWSAYTGPSISGNSQANQIYSDALATIAGAYEKLLAIPGVKIEDARGILPTNILTNIVASCNMRTLVETIRKRSSPRTQGEYRDVLTNIKASVLEVHPWLSSFIERDRDRVVGELDTLVNGLAVFPEEIKTTIYKLSDELRAG